VVRSTTEIIEEATGARPPVVHPAKRKVPAIPAPVCLTCGAALAARVCPFADAMWHQAFLDVLARVAVVQKEMEMLAVTISAQTTYLAKTHAAVYEEAARIRKLVDV
jgi:hypothetical protein